jgi:hypothetical protein
MPGLAFLNPALLWGLGVASIPILLHLLQRRRYRVRRWAAMEFLRASVRRSSRRLRIEQWLLLLVRTLILLCVALALARPVWHSPRWGWLGSQAASQVVLVLDDSYSMGLQIASSGSGPLANPGSKTQDPESDRFGWARGRALELLRGGLASGDSVAVLLAGEPARALVRRPTFNLAEVTEQIRQVPLSDRRSDLAGAARLCLEILKASRVANREVYLLTDSQTPAWRQPGAVEAWKQVAEAGRLHLVSPPPAQAPNLAVAAVQVSEPVIPARPVPIAAQVLNRGDRAAQDVVVTLHADGRAVTSTRVNVPVDGTAEVRFEHAFPAAGSHTLVVSLPEDRLPVDDRGYASVVARERVRVLVLNGHPDPDPRRDAAFFVTAALAPDDGTSLSTARTSLTDPFDLQVIEGSSFRGEDLTRWDVVVLADVPRLAAPERRALAGFVEEGGGLLVLPGASALRPARLGPLRDAGSEGPSLDLGRVDHPALARFRGAADVDLSTARFGRYYQLGTPDAASGARVVCRFTAGDRRQATGDSEEGGQAGRSSVARRLSSDTGSPALVERAVGLGRVVMLASPPSPEWNTLPFKPAYLPFLHSLIAYLGQGPGSQRNLRVGDPLVAAVGGAQASKAGQSWVLEGPNRERVPLRPGAGGAGNDRRVVRMEAMTRAGLYRLQPAAAQATPAQAGSAAVPGAWYAVNLRTDESDLRSLSRREVEGRLRPAAVRWVDAHEALATVVREGRQGREAWRWLLFAALALMLCESGMAQVFGRRRGL